MKVKLVIQTASPTPGGPPGLRHTELWAGELDLLSDTEYVTKISLIGEGQPRPLADIPFAIGIGFWVWIPPQSPFDEAYGAGWNTEEGNT